MTTGKRPGEGSIWLTRPIGAYPQIYVEAKGELIDITSFAVEGSDGWGFALTRQEARLLARRINQCLDATVKR